MLRGRRDAFRISFIKLYLSTLKLNVGPAGNRTSLREGAMGVRVKARRWVTLRAGAIVR